MDQSCSDQFLQRHLGKAVDIHGAPAHKERKSLDLFGCAFRICADQHLRIIIPAN